MKKYISSLRLRTLPLALSGVTLGSFWVVKMYEINFIIFLGCIFTTLFLQISSNLANEIGDFKKGTDNENRVGPKYGIQAGQLSLKQLYTCLYFFVALSAISGILLLGYSFNWTLSKSFFIFILFGCASIIAALTYTLGKHPYGYLGLGDLFVFLFFGLLSVYGAYFLQVKTIETNLIFPAVIVGFWSVAVLNVNNMRDIVNDRKSGKQTLVTLLGIKKAKIYHLFLIIVPILIILYTQLLLALVLLPIWIYHLIIVFSKNGKQLDAQLPLITISTFISTFLIISNLYLSY